MMTERTELDLLDIAIDDLIQAALLGDKIVSRKNALKAQIARLIVPDVLDAKGRSASLTTPQGQLEYYRDLVEEVAGENKRLSRDLAQYEAEAELEDTPSLFERVMTASPAYVARFGGVISLEGAMRKMHEEWDEMHEEIDLVSQNAAHSLDFKATENSIARERLAKEAIDLLVTIGGVLHALDVPITLTAQAADATLEKLDSRTTDDYAWNDTSRTVEKKSKIKSHDNDYAQLKALGEHRKSVGPAIETMVTVEYWQDRVILTLGDYELVIMKYSEDPRPIRFTGVTIRTLNNLIDCHALLTRARQIMAERGTA